jgi:chorismate dehydratase
MAWLPLSTGDGSSTLIHSGHGEACHSRAGAWQESRERYARACGLADFRGETFRLLDVGTGLGLNLAAAIEALDETGARLEAVTLERDASVLEAGLALPQPPEVERWMSRVRKGIDENEAGSFASIRLVLGDARETLPALDGALRFDAVFLDPFSPRVEPDLWSPGFLAEIARRMAPGSILSTYSAAISVRAGLAAAGLRVGPGGRVGTKREGTLASPDRPLTSFDERTMRRIVARPETSARPLT